MKIQFVRVSFTGLLALCFILPFTLRAQTKQSYNSLEDALRSAGSLYGNPGPQSVNWTNGGNKYSYIDNDEIRSMDPQALKDDLIFSSKGYTFPGSTKPFNYESFQWSHDSKHLVFKTNFRPIYRRSGVADYYIYSLESKQLKQAVKDARSAELSPNGTKVGMERNGNMFVYDFAAAKETQLTSDKTSENGTFNGHYDWVYEEEFGQAQAWNWSPDSKYMAFWQFNERPVPDFQMTN